MILFTLSVSASKPELLFPVLRSTLPLLSPRDSIFFLVNALVSSFTTLFKSAPSFNLSYRPNDSLHPFSLRVKAGTSLSGSPINAPITFTAEFDLLPGKCSRFFLHFKPKLGDFTFRRSVKSQNLPYQSLNFTNSVDRRETSKESDDDDVQLQSVVSSGDPSNCGKFLNCIDDAVSGVEVRARTTFKVMDWAAVKFRWSVRFPVFKMPCLELRKIGIESVEENDEGAGGGEYLVIKKQMNDLWKESQSLKKNIDRLRLEIGDRKDAPAASPVESTKKSGLKTKLT